LDHIGAWPNRENLNEKPLAGAASREKRIRSAIGCHLPAGRAAWIIFLALTATETIFGIDDLILSEPIVQPFNCQIAAFKTAA